MTKFTDKVGAMEKATAGTTAAAIIDPTNPKRHGRVVIWGKGSRRHAIAWLPDIPGTPDHVLRHYGMANGYGYDKNTAAMGGAEFVAPDGTRGKLKGEGQDWYNQLRDAGFLVIVAV